ncbi:MAG: methylmalonyl Co-A mutase-associated GTPase MeaB [Acidobacteria bacterium]|nr:methylmalonyl Co-A mutase-associated GTPase MeaB [Acidobacteriota bacterium]
MTTTENSAAKYPTPRSANLDEWAEGIRRGDPHAVAQAITAVENRDPSSQQLLRRLYPHTGRATLIGITGAPGTGKSTLVDALTSLLRQRGHSVGILAVDPTSPFSGGAILGDRIRMQAHAADSGIFIRSMATRGALGGLAAATFDAAMVLDAAGKQFILLETVGVGQDEVEIARIADVTLLLLVPGMGDDVQAFKAGVMEIADLFVLNKSDYPGADRLEEEIRAAMSLAVSPPAWQPPIVRTVATRSEGVGEVLDAALKYLTLVRASGAFEARRKMYWRGRVLEIVQERLMKLLLPPVHAGALDQVAEAVAARRSDPYTTADQFFEQTRVAPRDDGGEPVLDHLGVAVQSLEEAVVFYETVLGLKAAGYETIVPEKTQVAMLPLGDTRIELLEATAPDSPIGRFLANRGPGLHHLCLRVPDLAAAVERLRNSGARLINEEPGTGAGGHKYVFVHPASSGGVLLELVEESRKK